MSIPVITPRERFLAAFSHTETDRVPVFESMANASLFPHYLGRENRYCDGGPMVEISRLLGLDAAIVYDLGYTSLIHRELDWTDDAHFTNEFGIEHTVSPASWPLGMATNHPFATREGWDKTPRPDPHAEWRYTAIRDAVAESHRGKSDDLAVLGGVRGAFTVMFIGMGLENMSYAIYDDPDLLREMSAYFSDFWTQIALREVEMGVDAIFISNDMGFNSNTLVAADTMREIFIPDLKRQVQAIKASGCKVILHSCGCINPILPELVDTGIDGLNPMQRAAGMDIGQIKREYGDRLTLIGNVDATNVLTSREPGVIEEAVREAVRLASAGGGHVMASDHSLHGAVPFENIERFVAAAKKFGVYPLRLDD